MKGFIVYIPCFKRGGAERVASVMINFWTRKNLYDVTVINTSPKDTDFYDIESSTSRIFLNYDYSKKPLFNTLLERVRRFRILRETIRDSKENVIVSFMSHPSLLMVIATIGLDKRVVCCEHTNYYNFGNKITRQVRNLLYYFLADKVTVLTERDVYNYPFYLRNKITVLPNPLGVDGFIFEDSSISSSNPPIKKVRLLFVGSLIKVKGIERLCKILNGIKSENWHLTICGDGELRSYLETQIKKNYLTNRVTIVGAVKNMHDFYLNSDLLLMTSIAEGLPMVIAESLSFGVPVIAFDCPTGPREFIKQYHNGVLVPDGEIDEYIRELEKLISDPELLKNLSKNGKPSIKDYKTSNINNIWEKMFAEL